MKVFKKIIIYYIVLFLIGCSYKPVLSVQEARRMQSKIINGEPKIILKECLNILQDMYFTIETIDSDMGLLIASKETQVPIGEIREENSDDETSLLKKIFFGLFIFSIFTGLLLLFKNDGDSDRDHYHHHHHHHERGDKFYKYKITINATDYDIGTTNLRISAVGKKFVNGKVVKAGPLQDSYFYHELFMKIENEI